MFKLAIILALFLSVHAKMITRTKVQMGTFVSISLDEKDKKHFKKAFRIIDDVDKSLSSFNNQSPLYKLNQNRYTRMSPYLFEALKLSQKYYEKTDGYFDIAIGNITKDAYRFGLNERIPTKKELHDNNVSLSALVFNKENARVKNGIKIDLGGMGKGYGVSQVVKYFKLHDISEAKIAASGDIRCLLSCRIEVNNPFAEKALASFNTKYKDMGISTSGNYEHYVKTKKNNHLINPKTKQSQQNFISITLISKLPSSDLDAYATAVSVMPTKKAYEFLNALPVGYIVLQSNKDLIVSKNIDDYVENMILSKSNQKR